MISSGLAAPSFSVRCVWTTVLLAVPQIASATLVGAGDIAFIRFNADGTDDFAIVLLADADMGQQVHFNDNEWHWEIEKFASTEDQFTWNITEDLAAGTVVTFSNLSSGSGAGIVSHGTITGDPTNTMPLGENGESVYAFLGTDNRNPSSFLSAVSTQDSSELNNTGLINGETAIVLPGGIDEAHYIGARDTELAFADYRALIGNLGQNWQIRLENSGTIDPPFQSTNFTLALGTNVPESPRMIWLGLFGMLSLLATSRRRQTACLE